MDFRMRFQEMFFDKQWWGLTLKVWVWGGVVGFCFGFILGAIRRLFQ